LSNGGYLKSSFPALCDDVIDDVTIKPKKGEEDHVEVIKNPTFNAANSTTDNSRRRQNKSTIPTTDNTGRTHNSIRSY
jgi:hypothetical protein